MYYVISVSALVQNEEKLFSSTLKAFSILAYICSTVLAFLMIPTISLVTDLIVPSNHSKEISLPVIADYGVDTQQYFYYVFICICITVFIIGVVIFTTYSAYMLYVQHACALFAIVR